MKYCDTSFDGLGTKCRHCGSWQRGREGPTCPPYITRSELHTKRLPHIKTAVDNQAAYDSWWADRIVSSPEDTSDVV